MHMLQARRNYGLTALSIAAPRHEDSLLLSSSEARPEERRLFRAVPSAA